MTQETIEAIAPLDMVELKVELQEIEKDEQEVLHFQDRYAVLHDRLWAEKAVSSFHSHHE